MKNRRVVFRTSVTVRSFFSYFTPSLWTLLSSARVTRDNLNLRLVTIIRDRPKIKLLSFMFQILRYLPFYYIRRVVGFVLCIFTFFVMALCIGVITLPVRWKRKEGFSCADRSRWPDDCHHLTTRVRTEIPTRPKETPDGEKLPKLPFTKLETLFIKDTLVKISLRLKRLETS